MENNSESIYKRKKEDLKVIAEWTSADLKGPKRQEGEEYVDYKIRLRREKMWEKLHLQGEVVWMSKKVMQDQNGFYWNEGGGTYVKSVHGNLF